MSHLVQAKTAAFTQKLEERSKDPEFRERQAAYEQANGEANAELTALLAAHKDAGTVPSEEELRRFPSPCASPLEVLSREIYAEIANG